MIIVQKNNSFQRTLYIYRKWVIHNNLLTGHHLSRIMPSSGIFFLINEFRANLLPLLWVWFDPCRQCVNLRDDISFPQFFPDLYFQSLGKKYWTLKEFYSRSVWLRGSFYMVLYQYSLHLQITLVKQKVTLIFSELVKWKIIRKKTCN